MKYGIWFGRGGYVLRGRQCAVVHGPTARLKGWAKEDPGNRIVVKRTVNVSDGSRNMNVKAAAIAIGEVGTLPQVAGMEFVVARVPIDRRVV